MSVVISTLWQDYSLQPCIQKQNKNILSCFTFFIYFFNLKLDGVFFVFFYVCVIVSCSKYTTNPDDHEKHLIVFPSMWVIPFVSKRTIWEWTLFRCFWITLLLYICLHETHLWLAVYTSHTYRRFQAFAWNVSVVVGCLFRSGVYTRHVHGRGQLTWDVIMGWMLTDVHMRHQRLSLHETW